MTKFTIVSLLCAITVTLEAKLVFAQTGSAAGASSRPKGDTSIFAPLTIPPAPSATRLANGAHGPRYWQNRADYDLKTTLDTATHTVRGSMTLRYTNHSPNALSMMWFQTEQKDEVIDRFDQVLGAKSVALAYQHAGSDVFETQVTLAEPLRSGKTATFRVEWHFTVPDLGRRMGRDGTAYQIGQWYPRPNVYDDVKGWNTESYATAAEFFLEYGDYTMEVTLPAGYIVAATGMLDNAKDVLTATEIARLAQAARSDTVIRIITAGELSSGAARPMKGGTLTWKFHAKNVRDAVWCAAPDYQWDAASWHGILAQSYYRPSTAAIWMDAADQARMSIQEYSERWYPYPYPQVSAVQGQVFGMEYPMLAMEADTDSVSSLYHAITHEIGHNWFPMIVGSNERVHMWMDEGFNTFINSFSEARRYPAKGDQNARIKKWVAKGDRPPLEDGTIYPSDDLLDRNQYFETAKVLQLLRRDVIGPDTFDKAFHTYIRRWAYKHPTPVDFFRTMNDVSGRNLDWFWRGFFLESAKFDQSIDSVKQTARGSDTQVSVTYGNRWHAVLPLLVHFSFSDGTTRDFTYPVEVWKANPASYTVSYKFSKKTVSSITLDQDKHLPDADRENNVWTAK